MVKLFCRRGSWSGRELWLVLDGGEVEPGCDVEGDVHRFEKLFRVYNESTFRLQNNTQEVTSHFRPEGLELLRELHSSVHGCGHWAEFFWKWPPHKQLSHLLRQLPPSTRKKRTARERRKALVVCVDRHVDDHAPRNCSPTNRNAMFCLLENN